MNKNWLIHILVISIVLLTILKCHELNSLSPYFKPEKIIKLKSFETARTRIQTKDLDLLKLWESILTGRSAPLSRFMKERYQKLGMNHLFTPSGFHLSAVLFPFLKLFKNSNQRLIPLITLGLFLFFLPGLGALKRMLLIKTHQNIFGLHVGFIFALLLDVLFGTFQNSALSFTYSFLFLGIIYSGPEGILLIIWFFFGQLLLAYFQGSDISLLLLFFSPILNFGFALLMPLLFLLSFPLWDWQLHIGIGLLRLLQWPVDHCAMIIQKAPTIEVNIFLLVMIALVIFRLWKQVIMGTLLFCNSLNLDPAKTPGFPANEFVPQGKILKSEYREEYVKIYLSDGNCRLKLIRGMWWENCSPRRRSKHKQKIKKLSYPS
jgi:hypothetical protein